MMYFFTKILRARAHGIKCSRKIISLLTLFSLSTVFVHPLVSFITWVIMLLIPISLKFHNAFLSPTKRSGITAFPLILMLSCSMLVRWITTYCPKGNFLFVNVRSMVLDLRTMSPASVERLTLAPEYEYLSVILYDLPFTLLLFFGILGVFFLYDSKPKVLKFPLASIPVFLVFSVYGSGFLGVGALLPHRWFPFIEVLLALPASYGVCSLASATKGFSRKLILLCIVFSVFVFSSMTSPLNSGNSAFYAKEMATRAGFTNSEVNAAAFIAVYYSGPISKFSQYHLVKGDIIKLTDPSTYYDRMVVVRNYEKVTLTVIAPEFSLDDTPRHNIIYANAEVQVYLPP